MKKQMYIFAFFSFLCVMQSHIIKSDIIQDKKNEYDSSFLLKAAQINDVEKIKEILSDNSHLAQYRDSKKAFVASCTNQNIETMKLFLDYGIDPNTEFMLKKAVLYNNLEMAKLLLKYGACAKRNQSDALFYAVGKCNEEMVTLLLEHGANANSDRKILEMAIKSNNQKIVSDLLNYGASPSCNHLCIRDVDPMMFKLLLKRAENINCQHYPDNRTPLMCQSKKENIELLLNHKADLTLETHRYTTTWIGGPRHDYDFIGMMIPKIGTVYHGGDTALHIHALGGHADIVDLLLQHGADLNAINNAGETPFDCAVANGHEEIAKTLLKHKNITAKDVFWHPYLTIFR